KMLLEIGLDSADALLAAIAQRLRDTVGPDTVAARFSEHTLAVLAPGDHAATSALAETILQGLSAQVLEAADRSSLITASIGGVQIGEKIASVGQVLAKATE